MSKFFSSASYGTTERPNTCFLLQLPTEITYHILMFVRQSDESYRLQTAKATRRAELNEDESRVDPFYTIHQESWQKLYGNGMRALYVTCRILRDKVRPYLYENLRLSGTNDLAFLTNIQFFIGNYVKIIEFDDVKKASVVDDTHAFLRSFLVQLIGFQSLERLIFSSEDTMRLVASILPRTSDLCPVSSGPDIRRFETLSAVSDHLAKNIKSIQFTATVPDTLGSSSRFPCLSNLSFKRATDPTQLLSDQAAQFGAEAAKLEELEELEVDFRTADEHEEENDLLPPTFFDSTSQLFPWNSAATLTCLTFIKLNLLRHDYLFITQFVNLKSLSLDIQKFCISNKTEAAKTFPTLTHLLASGMDERELSDLLGLLGNSPLGHIKVVLSPVTDLPKVEKIYKALQPFSPTLLSLTLGTEGWVECPCDEGITHRSPTHKVEKATVEVNSDSNWRDITNGETNNTCCPDVIYQSVMKEAQEVLDFGIRKLEVCRQMRDGAGIWELSRWLINLRARKYLEDHV